MVGCLGLAAVALAGSLMQYFPWALGGVVLAASLGGALWFWHRGQPAKSEVASGPRIDASLRIVEKTLPAKPRLPHGLRVTVSTEMAVNLGVRVACDGNVHEVEALAQTGRGASARQDRPPAVRQSRRAFLFAVRNSPLQRELFLRVDLYGAQPLHLEAVELIRPAMVAALPEWHEAEATLAPLPGAIPEEAAAPPEAGAAPEAGVPPDAPDAEPAPEAPPEAPPAEPAAAGPPDTSLSNPLP